MSNQDTDGAVPALPERQEREWAARVTALAREIEEAIPRAIEARAERENVRGRPPKFEAPYTASWPLAEGASLLPGGDIYLEDDGGPEQPRGRLLRADQVAGWALEALREDAYQPDAPEPQVAKALEAWLGAIRRLIDS
jgi:hypothetical protein